MRSARTGSLTLPGAATPTLRNINKLWNIQDASLAVPYTLHPQGEHCANRWSTIFQTKLGDIVKITHPNDMQAVKQQMQIVVTRGSHGQINRVRYLTVADLAVVLRYFKRKRKEEEVRASEISAARESQRRMIAQQRVPFLAGSLEAQCQNPIHISHDQLMKLMGLLTNYQVEEARATEVVPALVYWKRRLEFLQPDASNPQLSGQ